jgi:anthranilate/para-aminobenzoate synthase component II
MIIRPSFMSGNRILKPKYGASQSKVGLSSGGDMPEERKPLLGICAGMQLLNIFFGGKTDSTS